MAWIWMGFTATCRLLPQSTWRTTIPHPDDVIATPPSDFFLLLEKVRSVLPPDITVYVVGGAVRDYLLSRPTHDLDFVLPGDAIKFGRRVANALGGAFYPLDEERDTARVILTQPDGSRLMLDFAAQRGPDLESDLRARDFTLNAIAIDLNNPTSLLDPLDGAADLRAKSLRACSAAAFVTDPLRILRGVRLATGFGFHIQPETRQLMRQAVGGLPDVSPERLRDELFRILDGPHPATALRALDRLGVLPYTLPELRALDGVTQSPPHYEDVWNHTLSVLQKLETVLKTLALQPDPEAAANLALAPISLRLGRYREQFQAHFSTPLNPQRSVKSLLFLAALYHDIAKPNTRQVQADGRIRFLEHEQAGEKMVAYRASQLHLSNDEIGHLKTIVRHHMRPLLLAQTGQLPTRRAVYRFYRDTGAAGIDVCLHSLADSLATHGTELPQELWGQQIDVVRALLEAWWERPHEAVSPPVLINGNDLIEAFNLQPGPEVGRLLEMVREAQAAGEVSDREGALALARLRLLKPLD
jgi:tRNA nucleotidyltransferase/poly(A) polymerase